MAAPVSEMPIKTRGTTKSMHMPVVNVAAALRRMVFDGDSLSTSGVAMIAIHAELKRRNLKTRMLLQVHDELVFDLFKSERDEVLPMVEDKMKTAIPLEVPIVVELGTGKNWLEAH